MTRPLFWVCLVSSSSALLLLAGLPWFDAALVVVSTMCFGAVALSALSEEREE